MTVIWTYLESVPETWILTCSSPKRKQEELSEYHFLQGWGSLSWRSWLRLCRRREVASPHSVSSLPRFSGLQPGPDQSRSNRHQPVESGTHQVTVNCYFSFSLTQFRCLLIYSITRTTTNNFNDTCSRSICLSRCVINNNRKKLRHLQITSALLLLTVNSSCCGTYVLTLHLENNITFVVDPSPSKFL